MEKSLFYLYLQETCEEDIQESQTTPSIPPPLLAEKITSWLAENGVSQMVFAKLHMERSQGTMSVYLNNLPKEVPPGLGKTPWVMMKQFMNCSDVRDEFLEKARG